MLNRRGKAVRSPADGLGLGPTLKTEYAEVDAAFVPAAIWNVLYNLLTLL